MVSRALCPLVGFGYSNIVYIPISITLVLSPGAIFKLGTIHHIHHHGISSRMYRPIRTFFILYKGSCLIRGGPKIHMPFSFIEVTHKVVWW